MSELDQLNSQIDKLRGEIGDLQEKVLLQKEKNKELIDKNKILLGICIDNLDKGWIPVKVLSTPGVQNLGIYVSCSLSDCKYLMKIYNYDQAPKEGEFTKKAGELGIGAPVHEIGHCKDPSNNRSYGYIIMNKLDGGDFGSKYNKGFDPKYITEALDKYYILLQNDIIHNDPKTSNIMFDANDKMYIIDYGRAFNFSEIPKEHRSDLNEMMIIAELLLSTMYYKSYFYDNNPAWNKDLDINKYNNLINNMITVREWMKSKGFGNIYISVWPLFLVQTYNGMHDLFMQDDIFNKYEDTEEFQKFTFKFLDMLNYVANDAPDANVKLDYGAFLRDLKKFRKAK